jgi:hypothetical protein
MIKSSKFNGKKIVSSGKERKTVTRVASNRDRESETSSNKCRIGVGVVVLSF